MADAEASRRSQILRFWRSVEFFTAQKVDPADPDKRRYDVRSQGPAPWEDEHPLPPVPRAPRPGVSEHVWQYTVYGGVFDLDRVHDELARVFGSGETEADRIDADERVPRGQSALFAVDVSSEGRLLLESLTLSQAAWAVGRAERATSDPGWLDGFGAVASQFASDVAELVQAAQDDARARELSEKGVEVSRPVGAAVLRRLVMAATDALGAGRVLEPRGVRVACFDVDKRREHEPRGDFLNSFFTEDLQRVADAVAVGRAGPGLAAYLASGQEPDRLDVRAPQNRDALVDMLAPEHVPAGRWPTKPEHSLATSQQLAVNQIVGRLAGGAGVFGVNGPPGTGKTTMLRDLVAAQVVERARRLAALRAPSEAFTRPQLGWRTEESPDGVWFPRLVPALTGFEMVVASANNGAVENVTRELPAANAVADPWKDADYLGDHATRLLAGDSTPDARAWGLVAAVLGNRRNRSDFVSRLWFTPRHDPKQEPGPRWLGLLDELRQHDHEDRAAWSAAVAAFRQAEAAEAAIRAERQAAHEALRRQPGLETALQAASGAAENARQVLGRARDAHSRAEHGLAEATAAAEAARSRRREHRETKPGVIDTIFTLGAALRRWIAADEPYAVRQHAAEAAEEEATAALRASTETVRYAEAAAAETARARDAADQALAHTRAVVDQVRASMTGEGAHRHVPDGSWRADDNEQTRETCAPWLDASWNTARTDVFLAALDLHQALLRTAGKSARLLLSAAIDAVRGKIPGDVSSETHRAAWQGLFLLVPVISTTFASVGRMLGHVGAEAFGWLLIDEAGQATPQAAVGAVWRSRRVVAVGDPLQLEPVLTVLHTTQARLCKHHGVDHRWTPDRLSVQTVVDEVTPVGTSLESSTRRIWVGSPLRVHRRCDDPMFSIVNEAVYDGLMISGVASRSDPLSLSVDEHGHPLPGERPVPTTRWFDVRSADSKNHWVPAEGEKVDEILRDLLGRYGLAPKDILVVTPFRAVADGLKSTVAKVQRDEAPDGQRITCGTVHVSQGKEAKAVVFVLGGGTVGAREWAAGRPNLFNVAVSRAQHRLFVVGDRESWKDLPYFNRLASLSVQDSK